MGSPFAGLGNLSQGVSNDIAGLGGLFGAASGFFPTPTTTTTNGSFNNNSTQTSTPNLDPATQAFLDQLRGQYSQLAAQPIDLSGYKAQQSNSINNNANALSQQAAASNAARGLSTSPVATTATNNINLNRSNQLNTLNQSIPLLQNQLQLQNLGAAGGFFNSIPKGSTTTGNQNGTSKETKTVDSGGGVGGLISGIGSVAAMFSDKRMKKDFKSMSASESKEIINKLKPIAFSWKENSEPGHGFKAQDVAKVLPKSVVKDDNGFHRLDMIQIIPHLVNAVQSLQKKVA